MNAIQKLIVSTSLAALATPALASNFEVGIGLHDKMLQAEVQGLYHQFSAGMGVEYNYHVNGGQFFGVDLFKQYQSNIHEFNFGIKYHSSWLKERSNSNNNTISLGGQYKIEVVKNFYLNAQGFYAPRILTFGEDYKQFYRINCGIQWEMLPDLIASAGYNKITYGYEDINYQYDNSFLISFKMKF
jgi:hypothetical protein